MDLVPGIHDDPQAEFLVGLAQALSDAGEEGEPQLQPVASHERTVPPVELKSLPVGGREKPKEKEGPPAVERKRSESPAPEAAREQPKPAEKAAKPAPREKPAAADELERKFPRLDPDMTQLVDRVAHEEGVDPVLLRAMARAESSGNPDAVSKKGAVGLFQLTPAAISDVGMDPREVLGNPELEARAAARYMKKLQTEYGAKTPEEVFAAYNGGPGQVIGKPPEEWPEESRTHAERVKALMERELGAETPVEGTPVEEAAETPAEEAAEPAPETAVAEGETEPGETLVDENGEPVTAEGVVTDEAGNPVVSEETDRPVTEEEVESSPIEAAKEVTPDEEEALLSPEEEAYLDKILKSTELTPRQRLGIATLAIQHPELAIQYLQQREAGRREAIRAGLNLIRERMIERRMEKKQGDLLFRQQVNEFHRRHRELLDQMAKDGIPIDNKDLPEIPADIQTPEELEAAEKALQQWTARYSQAKHTYEVAQKRTATLLKAADITRKGGVGSAVITSAYPEWEKDPELRDYVQRLRKEERRNEEMGEVEVRRVEGLIATNRKTVERMDAQIAQIREQIRAGRINNARLIDQTAKDIAAQLKQLQETKAAYELALGETWSPRTRMVYRDGIRDLDSTIFSLQAKLQELSYLRDAALSDRMPEGHPREAISDPAEAYQVLQGQIALEADRWNPPGAAEGVTLKYFIEHGLQGGNADLVNKYGGDVIGFVYQKALDITQDRGLAAMLAQKWLDETASGGGWLGTTFGSALSGEEIRQRLTPAIGQQIGATPESAPAAPAAQAQ